MAHGRRVVSIACLIVFGMASTGQAGEGVEIEKRFDVGEARITRLHVSAHGEAVAATVFRGELASVVRDGDSVGPSCSNIYEVAFGPDGRAIAHLGETKRELFERAHRAYRDGKPGPEQKGYGEFLTFSPDGRSVAWVAGSTYVVVDGKRVGGPYEKVTNLRYLPGSGDLVYTAERDDGWTLVRNGKAGEGGYGQIHDLIVSPDGKSVMFCAWKDSRRVLVRDGEDLGKGFRKTEGPAYAPDGKSVAFFGFREKSEDEKDCYLVVRGKETHINSTGGYGILFRGDGALAAYVVRDDDGKSWVAHGTEEKVLGGPYSWVPDVVAGAEAGSLAFAATDREGNRDLVVRDGKPVGGPYEARSVKALHLAPDGRSLAFLAKREGKWTLMRDGEPVTTPFDDVTEIVESSDGRTLVFGARTKGVVYRVRMSW